MINGLRVLGLVPARGGSKGVKRKNLIKLNGRTLTEWAIINLKKCSYIDNIIMSSEDEDIINTIKPLGDYVPFKRHKELSEDHSKSIDVINHAIQFEMQFDRHYDLVALSEPSCPFRLPEHFNKGLQLISLEPSITSVVSLVSVGDKHPIRMKKLLLDGKIIPYYEEEPEGLRRQEQEKVFIRNGGVYIFRTQEILNDRLYGDNIFGFEVDVKRFAVNIDEEVDVKVAKIMVEEFLKNNQLEKLLPID